MKDRDILFDRQQSSWRLLRWFAVGLFLPLTLIAIIICAAAWRLAQKPLDVTFLAAHWQPVPINLSADQPLIGHVRWKRVLLGWTPHIHNTPAGIIIKAEHVELAQVDGHVMDKLDHVTAVLNVGALLRGHLAFRAVRVKGASFALKHYEDGTIALDLAGLSPSQQQTPSQSGAAFSLFETDALRDVEVSHLLVTMKDAQRPTEVMHFHMPIFAGHYRHKIGWKGRLKGVFHWGNDDVPFQLLAEPQTQKKTHLILKVEPFVPARLAGWVPTLQADNLRRWQFPVRVIAEGDIQPEGMGGRPLSLSTHFSFGQGEILQPGHNPLNVQEGEAHFALKWSDGQPFQNVMLDQGKIHLVMRDADNHLVPVTATSHVHIDNVLHPSDVDVDINAQMPNFDFATLGSVWPYGVMKGARRWMTENMTEGRGDGLVINAHLQSHTGIEDLDVSRLEGVLDGHDLTVHWLRPVQPVTGLEAHAHFLNPDTLQVDVAHGRLSDGNHGVITVPKGGITVSGLMEKDQYGRISLGLEGKLPSFLKVLSHPRLHLFSGNALGIQSPEGDIKGSLTVSLPLDSNVLVSDIGFGAAVNCQNIAFEAPGVGPVQYGQGKLTVGPDELRFNGKADIRHVPVEFSILDSFLANEPGRVLRKVKAQAWVDSVVLGNMGIALPEGTMTGAARVAADYVQTGLGHGHRQANVNLHLDLTPVAIHSDAWSKPNGVLSVLEGRLQMLDTHIQGVPSLTASGPELALSGAGVVTNNHLTGVQFSHIKLGQTEGRLNASWPGGSKDKTPYRVDIAAQTLDLAPWLAPHTQPAVKKPRTSEKKPSAFVLPAGEWRLSLQANRLFYAPGRAMTGVVSDASWGDRAVEKGSIQVAGPHPLSVRLEPASLQTREHRLEGSISNLGALIGNFGGYHQLDGGDVHVKGAFAGKGSKQTEPSRWAFGLGAFKGRVDVKSLALTHPPAMLTAATLLSPLHWGEIGRDRFGDMEGAALVEFSHNVIGIQDGRLSNAILGATLEGTVDVQTEKLALKGTVSPIFRLNHAAGNIFGMHAVLAPEKGSGVMALTYRLGGIFAKPTFQANPISIFLPGMLRHIVN